MRTRESTSTLGVGRGGSLTVLPERCANVCGSCPGCTLETFRLSHPFFGGFSRFRFLRGTGGGILWWVLPIDRPGVSEVSREVGGCVGGCCGVLLS